MEPGEKNSAQIKKTIPFEDERSRVQVDYSQLRAAESSVDILRDNYKKSRNELITKLEGVLEKELPAINARHKHQIKKIEVRLKPPSDLGLIIMNLQFEDSKPVLKSALNIEYAPDFKALSKQYNLNYVDFSEVIYKDTQWWDRHKEASTHQ